ncbi:MAG: cation-translocating P-type ATPase, partial [Bdellovibrionota bacterium]
GVMAVREVWAKEPEKLLYAAAACCNASLGAAGQPGIGDPTEVALLAAAAERGVHRTEIEEKNPRRLEIPFDSVRKRMSVLRSDGVLYVKGALESLLPLCVSGAQGASEEAGHMAARGLRVLAVAVGEGNEEKNLRLLGVVGIADPPRTEATRAVADAKAAGIRTVMITGDHPVTARAIAKEMGILGPGDSPEEIVHARVAPEDKLQIVRRWKDRGEVVAMTGDGVNDAPALREAHIGIAMGKDGTEVAREASDMVLLDDNFASIVAAIREGRGIYENIRKTIVYLLAGNAAEILLVLGASLAGLPIPLAPLQLLWINLVTDGLPALALVADPADPDVLKRPPRRQDEAMLGRPQWRFILGSAAFEALVALLAFGWYLEKTGLGQAQSLVFSVLVFSEVLRSLAARSDRKIFWEVGALSNFRLLAVIALSLFLQIAIHHFDLTVHLFDLHGIPLKDHVIAFGLGLIPVSAIEIKKLLKRG